MPTEEQNNTILEEKNEVKRFNEEEEDPIVEDDCSFVDLTSADHIELKHSDVDGLLVDLTAGDPTGADISFEESNCNEDIDNSMFNKKNNKEHEKWRATREEYEFETLPDRVYWESILGSLELCNNFVEMKNRAEDINPTLRPLRPRVTNVEFDRRKERIDVIATKSIPTDFSEDVNAIWTKGDGNCLTRSLSRAYIGDDSMHLEIRARIAIEAIVNSDKYLSDNFLLRGATFVQREESLVQIYAQYSDFYRNGQELTNSAVATLYLLEVHECTKVGAFMGLWQIAQAASVLNIPIRSIYPVGGDSIMRMDFNRWFFPCGYNGTSKDENQYHVDPNVQRQCT